MQLDGRNGNNGADNEKYKFTGKERDIETNYDYFGARYYDSRIGRWLSMDPLSGLYPGWSTYNYCKDKPVSLFDPNGKFPIGVHAQLIAEAKGSSYFIEYVIQVCNDVAFFWLPSLHFDNYSDFNSINDEIKSVGGFNNLDDHTMGDFYSHSNYVDIWYQMAQDGRVSGEMPLFDEVDWNSDFGKALINGYAQFNGLQTTAFPDSKNPPRGHDAGEIFRSKDYPGKNDKDPKERRQTELHDMAEDAYKRQLEKKYRDKKNLNILWQQVENDEFPFPGLLNYQKQNY